MQSHQKAIKRTAALIIIACLCLTCGLPAFAETKTGAGMAEWALRAYNEKWSYVYGGSSVGGVDCSGLIRSYTKSGGGAKALLDAASVKGDMSSMPRVHGLGLWCEGHAGVYVGKNASGTNVAVDARNSSVGVVYSTMDSRSWNPWVKWFKIQGVSYPTTGWVVFNGNKYYYRDGQFVVGVVTVDGVSYDFGLSGALKGEAAPTTAAPPPTTTMTAAPTTTAPPTTAAPSTTAATTTAKTTAATAAPTSATTTAPPATTAKTTAAATTAPTTTAKSVTLRQGDSGKEVTRLQERLSELGYMTVAATGYYGDQTVKAVKDFQRRVDITPDGIAGKETQDRLFASDAPAHEEPTTTTTTTTIAPAAATPPADGDAKETPGDTTAGDSSAQSTTTPDKDESNETTASVQTTTAPAPKYRTLDLGSKGDDVSKLQARLTELGYFDQEITGYYGVFTMDAVKRFQKKIMPYPTGVADEETQERIFADDAPWSADDADLSPMYDDEDALRIDGGEQDDYDENIASESDTPALAPPPAPDSPGIDGLSTRADVSEFIRKYGGNGALETLGIYGASGPKTVVYRGGERIEITPELERVMNECVFY